MEFIHRFVLAGLITTVAVIFGFILFIIASCYDNKMATGIYFTHGGMYFLSAGVFSVIYLMIEYFEMKIR